MAARPEPWKPKREEQEFFYYLKYEGKCSSCGDKIPHSDPVYIIRLSKRMRVPKEFGSFNIIKGANDSPRTKLARKQVTIGYYCGRCMARGLKALGPQLSQP